MATWLVFFSGSFLFPYDYYCCCNAYDDEDGDNDSLTNLEEYAAGTNPRDNDRDNDQMPNDWEKSQTD